MDKKMFKGKKVLVMGLGLNGGGVGVAKFFYRQGANVTVTDLKTEIQLSESIEKLKGLKIRYVLGKHEECDFKDAELIVKNPDVPDTSPYLEIARKNNVVIDTDVGLFFKLSKVFIVGVTGTKGKSTTASLIYHILRSKFKRTFLAGNIGVSPLELLPKVKKGDRVILELSSFELEGLKQSPNIAVVTNILPDHLNRYGSMEEYIEAKRNIYKYQSGKDRLILNGGDFIVRQFADEAKSAVSIFSASELPKGISFDNLRLAGKHNILNMLAAIEVAKILKISTKAIQKSLKSFNGVANRQEFVREVDGIKYFNDTTATMPDAVIAAIDSFSERFPGAKIILICGGQDKGLKYGELAKLIKEKVGELVMLPGTATEKISDHLVGYTNIYMAPSMMDAVKKAKALAQKGDIVVLSPAAASFNLFKNEFDRGNQFVKIVKDL